MKVKHNKLVQLLSNGMMILLILTIPLRGVMAQSGCDTIIVDDANVFGGNTSGIQDAIDNLAAYAEVRVITIESYGNSTLDAYISNIRQQCPSWQATDGGFKNNLIVFAISYNDQDTGIFYGNEWKDPLDANWTRIVSDFMNPKFGDGNFAGGFEAGINEVSRLVDLKVHPPSSPITGNGPVTIDQREPIDLSGFFRFLIIAVVLLAVVALIYFGVTWYNKWTKENEKRRRSQQAAKIKKQSLTSGIATWGQSVENIETDILGLKDVVDETVIARLASMVREAQIAFDQMLRHYRGLDSSAGDPDNDGLTEGQYDAIANAYDTVLEQLEAAQKKLAEATTDLHEVKSSVDQAPEALRNAERALDTARNAIREMTEQGFTIAAEIIVPIERLVELSRTNMQKMRPDLAYERAMEAESLAESLTKQVRQLPKRHDAVQSFLNELPGNIERLKAQVEKGRRLFDTMDDKYPAEPLAAIMGNGTEAEKRVRALMDMLDDLAGMLEKQQYDKAEKLIERAVEWMEEIDSFMRSITALNESLEVAVKAMQSELNAAETDVKKAQAFLAQHKDELDDVHFNALKEAEKALREALREMDKALPNPIRVVKLAKQANDGADAVLVKARQDAERIARLRTKAETELREATRLVSKVREYIEDHRSDVGSNAKAILRSAAQNLITATETADLERRIAFAEGAQEKATSAYDEAKDDVAEANQVDDDSDTTVVVWGNSTPVYQSTQRRETTSTWSAPTPRSNQGGGSLSWGGSSQRGSSISMPKSSMGGGSKKW